MWCVRWLCRDILPAILVRLHLSATTDDVCLHCGGIADNPLPFRDWHAFPPHERGSDRWRLMSRPSKHMYTVAPYSLAFEWR